MRVLIIEDDAIWQCKLQIVAEKAGLDVAPLVGTIEEAKLFLQKEIPDLIIADVYLNHDNIFNLFRNKEYKRIPTIFTTASQDEQDFEKAKMLDTYTFLVKPFHQYTLLSTISTLKKNCTESFEEKTIEDNIKISSVEIRSFYKLLGEDAIIGLFNLKEIESYILKQRWNELKTFSAIGKDLRLSSQRIQRIYSKIIDKIKVKTLSSVPKYQEYLEFSKHKKNRLEILKGTIEVQKINTVNNVAKFDAKVSIDSIEELNSKFKNVLWNKNIRTIEDLLQYSKRELLMFNKLGSFAVLEIEKALAERGFELKG